MNAWIAQLHPISFDLAYLAGGFAVGFMWALFLYRRRKRGGRDGS